MNAPNEERTFQVPPDAEGQRLDRFLTEQCPDYSRSQIQSALAADLVTVDGRCRPKSFRLTAGSEVCFQLPPAAPTTAEPQDLPLEVIHQDDDLLVVNKAAGMVVHPAPGHPDGTLVNALLHHCQDLAAAATLRPGIVHRLDRDTTGLLVVALNDRAHQDLSEQLKERRMSRKYLVLSWGRWLEDRGVIEGNIGRSLADRQKMAVLTRGGRPAVTRYEVREDFSFVQLCRVTLQTGRTHQIRVHFAHRSHPVVGDRLYGDDRRGRNVRPVERPLAVRLVKAARRQMLHAEELGLDHPRTGERLTFQAPLPADLAAVLADLRG